MNRQDMLTSLVASLATSPAGRAGEAGDLATLRAIVEEASDLGAERVLTRLGLNDDGAQGDIDELRELLQAWRAAKASAWHAAIDWTVRGLLALLLIGFALRFGLGEMLR